jgi:hypothetical protein
MRKLLFILLLFSCSKPEQPKPLAPDYTTGQYRIEVKSDQFIILWSVRGEQGAISERLENVYDSISIELKTVKEDQIWVEVFGAGTTLVEVLRNDTIIASKTGAEIDIKLTAY